MGAQHSRAALNDLGDTRQERNRSPARRERAHDRGCVGEPTHRNQTPLRVCPVGNPTGDKPETHGRPRFV